MEQSILKKYKKRIGLSALAILLCGAGTLGASEDKQTSYRSQKSKRFDLSEFLRNLPEDERTELYLSHDLIGPTKDDLGKKTREPKPESKVKDFYIQVGAFSDEKNIGQLVNELNEHGYATTTHPYENLTKVLVGEYSSIEQAINETGTIFDLLKNYGVDQLGILGLNESNNKLEWFSRVSNREIKLPTKQTKISKGLKKIKNLIHEEVEIYNSRNPKYAIDPELIQAIAENESSYDPSKIGYKLVSRWIKGKDYKKKRIFVRKTDKQGNHIPTAYGVMQLAPLTFQEVGIDYKNRFDARKNIRGGVRYFGKLLDMFNGDPNLAIAAYNAGPTKVSKLGRIPNIPETKRYLKKVLSSYNSFKENLSKKPDKHTSILPNNHFISSKPLKNYNVRKT